MKDEIMQTFRESADLKVRFIRQNAEVLGQVIKMVVEAFKTGNKVLLFGNGGSAADAQHIAAEFVNRYQIERPPLPAIALDDRHLDFNQHQQRLWIYRFFLQASESFGERRRRGHRHLHQRDSRERY